MIHFKSIRYTSDTGDTVVRHLLYNPNTGEYYASYAIGDGSNFSVYCKVDNEYEYIRVLKVKIINSYKNYLKSIIPVDYGNNEFSLNDIFKQHNKNLYRLKKIKKLI